MKSGLNEYPSAPWNLQGKGLQSCFLTKTSKIQKLIPNDLEIVNVIPGHTISLISAGIYDSRSSLSYNELIVCPAMVKSRGKTGQWISHIYVDSLNSQKGGKEIWKLKKKLASFHWGNNYRQLQVRSEEKSILKISIGKSLKIPMPSISLRAFSSSNEWLSSFVGKTSMKSKVGIAAMEYSEELFYEFDFKKAGIGIVHTDGRMLAEQPDLLFPKINTDNE